MIHHHRSRCLLASGGLACALLWVGCDTTGLTWYAEGSYQATFTDEDSTARQVTHLVSPSGGITTAHRVRLCDVRSVGWSLSGPIKEDRLAAVVTELSRSLCHVGVDSVTGGHGVVWDHPGADTMVVTGIPSTLWTITGTLTVTEYKDFAPPEPKVGSEAITERARGTFSVLARGPDGRTVRLDDGSFTLEITVRKFRQTLSDQIARRKPPIQTAEVQRGDPVPG